jgi:starvation-inducible DNA-binding protein
LAERHGVARTLADQDRYDRISEEHVMAKSATKQRTATAPAPLATPTDLAGGNGPTTVHDALNGILADTFALYLKTKNFHWHVSGPHFHDYHLMLDDQATQIFATTDLIAERVRKTGGTTLRSIGDIARRQRIADNDADFVSAADMLSELRQDNLALVASLREAKQVVDDAKDNATSAVIDDWTDEAERRAWFLFEASRTG